MQRIVLDTNCLLISLASNSPFHNVWMGCLSEQYTLCITNDIILEYEEILTQRINAEIAKNIIQAILNRKNVLKIDTRMKYQLITADPDDNKFVDCAIAANAKYIVTEDHHYDVLKQIGFPHIEVIRLAAFSAMI